MQDLENQTTVSLTTFSVYLKKKAQYTSRKLPLNEGRLLNHENVSFKKKWHFDPYSSLQIL